MLNGFKRGHKRFLLTISLGFLIIHISKQPIHHTNQIFFTDFHPCCNRQCDGPIFAQFPLKFYFQPLFLTSLFFFLLFFSFFCWPNKNIWLIEATTTKIYTYIPHVCIYMYILWILNCTIWNDHFQAGAPGILPTLIIRNRNIGRQNSLCSPSAWNQ